MKPADLRPRHIDYLNNVLDIPLSKEDIIELFAGEDTTDKIIEVHEKLLWKGLEYDAEKLDLFGAKSPMDQVSANQDLLIMFRDEKFRRMDPDEDPEERFFNQPRFKDAPEQW
ncbi:MAG: hypothetical protein IKD85_02125 [Firmicutes bacterium]|nr:hypothetical protein [Bacillota bacterium]